MNANFFKQIAKMDMDSKLMLTIAKATDSSLIISIFIQNDGCGDKAKNIIPPLNLSGSAEELDEGFFKHITAPLQTASGLISNMEVFIKQVEEAKKQSAMEKDKGDKEKKEKESKDKKYSEAMEKAETLEALEKFKEAWTALPKASEYPEYAETIRMKQELYERRFAPSLFTTES